MKNYRSMDQPVSAFLSNSENNYQQDLNFPDLNQHRIVFFKGIGNIIAVRLIGMDKTKIKFHILYSNENVNFFAMGELSYLVSCYF